MAEKRTRRRFTAEFKAEAVKRLLDGGKGLGEVATELGLSPGQLSGWRNEHLAAGSAEALAARKAEQAELQRLKRENKRLEEEVEILSSTLAIFRIPKQIQWFSGSGLEALSPCFATVFFCKWPKSSLASAAKLRLAFRPPRWSKARGRRRAG